MSAQSFKTCSCPPTLFFDKEQNPVEIDLPGYTLCGLTMPDKVWCSRHGWVVKVRGDQ